MEIYQHMIIYRKDKNIAMLKDAIFVSNNHGTLRFTVRVFCGIQQEEARNSSGMLWKNGNGQHSRNFLRSPLWSVGNYAVIQKRVPYGALPDIAGASGAFPF